MTATRQISVYSVLLLAYLGSRGQKWRKYNKSIWSDLHWGVWNDWCRGKLPDYLLATQKQQEQKALLACGYQRPSVVSGFSAENVNIIHYGESVFFLPLGIMLKECCYLVVGTGNESCELQYLTPCWAVWGMGIYIKNVAVLQNESEAKYFKVHGLFLGCFKF